MAPPSQITSGDYTHDVLVHDDDEELVAATLAFTEEGLDSGGRVLVHGSPERVDLFREVLGTHPRLEYGFDRDLYLSPSRTLFAYERKLAESSGTDEFWVTGTVPFGDDVARHPGWARYESLVNVALGSYPFHALCTYDTRALPATVIAAARAAHPGLGWGATRTFCPDYLPPQDFLQDSIAGVPEPPDRAPDARTSLHSILDLWHARDLLTVTALGATALDRDTVACFVAAVGEVLVNGLQHGGAPVDLDVWTHPASLTCLVSDAGPGAPDLLAGYRYPDTDGPRGLWVARQLCEELFLANPADGGCAVLLSTG